jgi:hypothetical protein
VSRDVYTVFVVIDGVGRDFVVVTINNEAVIVVVCDGIINNIVEITVTYVYTDTIVV